MRILLVNKFLFRHGGTETYILKLGEILASHGHEVQFFGMEHEKRSVGNSVNAYTRKMDFHTSSKLSKLSYSFRTIYSIEARKKIRMVLDDFKPDIVHLNNFNYQLTPSIILEIVKWRKETGYKSSIVFTAHDYNLICPNHMLYNPNAFRVCEKCIGGHYFNCFMGKCIHGSRIKSLVGTIEGYYWNLRKTYKNIDRIICCSDFLKSRMDKNPIFTGKTVTLHNFVDKANLIENTKRDYVLYFGRYSQEKGIQTLVEVCKKLPDVNFVFAGTGPLDASINTVRNINNVGFQSGEALIKLIKEARFSVYPSEWYENCPFSVMESQVYGTPVLGADIGGIPELIIEESTGELFKSGDSEDLKNKIYKLWKNKELTDKYSRNCNCIQFDDAEEYYKKLMNIYSL